MIKLTNEVYLYTMYTLKHCIVFMYTFHKISDNRFSCRSTFLNFTHTLYSIKRVPFLRKISILKVNLVMCFTPYQFLYMYLGVFVFDILHWLLLFSSDVWLWDHKILRDNRHKYVIQVHCDVSHEMVCTGNGDTMAPGSMVILIVVWHGELGSAGITLVSDNVRKFMARTTVCLVDGIFGNLENKYPTE